MTQVMQMHQICKFSTAKKPGSRDRIEHRAFQVARAFSWARSIEPFPSSLSSLWRHRSYDFLCVNVHFFLLNFRAPELSKKQKPVKLFFPALSLICRQSKTLLANRWRLFKWCNIRIKISQITKP